MKKIYLTLSFLILISLALLTTGCTDKDEKLRDGKLLQAVSDGEFIKVKELIAEGADVNAKNNEEWTALMIATTTGNTDIAKLLIDNKSDVNAKDGDGNTALMKGAIIGGSTAIVKLLIDNKADVNAEDDGGWTALMYAALTYPVRMRVPPTIVWGTVASAGQYYDAAAWHNFTTRTWTNHEEDNITLQGNDTGASFTLGDVFRVYADDLTLSAEF